MSFHFISISQQTTLEFVVELFFFLLNQRHFVREVIIWTKKKEKRKQIEMPDCPEQNIGKYYKFKEYFLKSTSLHNRLYIHSRTQIIYFPIYKHINCVF